MKLHEDIEGLFKTDEKETSEKYLDPDGDGIKYYGLTDKLQDFTEKYCRSYAYVYLAEYGTKLFKDGYLNASMLRTVGTSEGVEIVIDNLILDNEIQKWLTSLAEFIKFIYSNYIERTEVKATINLEL